jgi:hypothetical protein
VYHQPFPYTLGHTVINFSGNTDSASQHVDSWADEDTGCAKPYQFADQRRYSNYHSYRIARRDSELAQDEWRLSVALLVGHHAG